MSLGDGATWDETTPTDATQGIQIDDYIRDVRVGVSARMRAEHEWPASQAAVSEAGMHKFITLQNQASKPTLSGTQVAAIYQKTGSLYYENSAGVEVIITTGTAVVSGNPVGIASGDLTGTYPAPIFSTTARANVYNYTSLAASTLQSSYNLKVCFGSSTFVGAADASITNLPFANGTSYSIMVSPGHAAYNEGPGAAAVSGATATIFNNHGDAQTFTWLAVGV